MYPPVIRITSATLALVSVVVATIFALLGNPKNMGFIWAVAAIGAFLPGVVLATRLNPKKDAVLFIAAGVTGGVFSGAAGLRIPQSIPLWIWLICCLGTAVIAIVVDADSTQSKSVSRL